MMQTKTLLTTFCLLLCLFSSYFFIFKQDKAFSYPELIDYTHKKGVNRLFEKADALKYAQDYPKAAKAFESLLNKSLKPEERVYVINQLAFINLTMNEDSVAHLWFKQLDNTKYPLSIEAAADYHYNVGVWAYHTFKPKMSEAYLQKALSGYKAIYGEQHLRVGLCLTQLGMCFYDFGQSYDSSFKYIPLASYILQSKIELVKYSSECELGMSQVSFLKFGNEESLTHINNSLSILESLKLGSSLLYARSLSKKGSILHKIASLEKDSVKRLNFNKDAENYLKKAINIGKIKLTFRQQEFIRNLAIYQAKQKDVLGYKKSVAELQILLENQNDYYAHVDRLNGFFFTRLNQIDSGIQSYRAFWFNHIKDTLCSNFSFLEVAGGLHQLYSLKQDFDSSLYFQKQSILLATLKPIGKDLTWRELLSPNIYNHNKFIFISYFFTMQTLIKKFQVNKDFESLKFAFEISKLSDEKLYQSIFSPDEEAFLDYQKEYGEKILESSIDMAYMLYQKTQKREYLDWGFRFCERFKSMLLYRNLAIEGNFKKPNAIILDSIRYLNAEINRIQWEAENQSLKNNNLIICQNKLKGFYKIIEIEYPEYYKNKVQQVIPDIENVQKVLNQNQVLLHFTLCNNKWYKISISKKSTDFRQYDSVNTLNQDISKFKHFLSSRTPSEKDLNDYSKLSYTVYKKLLGDLPAQLTNKMAYIIVPDKSLSQIPFEALTTSMDTYKSQNRKFKDLPYLAKVRFISYSPSWKVYQNNGTSLIPKNPKIAALTYDFNSKELPYSNKEINMINKLFSKNVNLFIGEECTKDKFLQKANQYDIIHLSLHATSSTINKYDNRIYFAPKFKDTLFGYEILQKQIKPSLLVLSSCQTAEGKIEAGEGTFSISRYFLQSGAKKIVSSLWKIDDAATAELLTIFYKNLSENKEPYEALINAKRALILNRGSSSLFSHPQYWAGLILSD
jgi:CHAT domain-containing protein